MTTISYFDLLKVSNLILITVIPQIQPALKYYPPLNTTRTYHLVRKIVPALELYPQKWKNVKITWKMAIFTLKKLFLVTFGTSYKKLKNTTRPQIEPALD